MLCVYNFIFVNLFYFYCFAFLPARVAANFNYVQNITLIKSNFHTLDMKSLFTYIMSMADKSIISITSMYLHNIVDTIGYEAITVLYQCICIYMLWVITPLSYIPYTINLIKHIQRISTLPVVLSEWKP